MGISLVNLPLAISIVNYYSIRKDSFLLTIIPIGEIMDSTTPFKEITTNVDFCVIGGGIAGMLAAISAARHGASVAIMQDRPVLGGNASSEIRMWICGSEGKNLHETGLIEDIQLDNYFYNPDRIFSIWDSILYGAVRYEKGITMLLNCSANKVEMDGNKIISVTGWQTTTQKWQTVRAKLFADCSGDSVLAPLTGAEFRVGREAKAEFGESLGHEEADKRTMGMSCLIQAREMPTPQSFTPPPWAHKYLRDEDLKRGIGKFVPAGNYWWLELGGMQDSIGDTEEIRDELLRVAFGLWDHYKNHGEHGAENWALDWVGFLPGKRESRRYMGDYIMTQVDAEEKRIFDDVVAYGGWPLDDHDPHGFEGSTPSNIAIYITPPYQIPYRSLYSKNIENLFFAGRNISVTHAALSSTRVMCTCGIIGQAVGTAAAIAVKNNYTPRQVYEKAIRELQETLMDDDCFLPGLKRTISDLTQEAKLVTSNGDDAEVLRNGYDRPLIDDENGYFIPMGESVAYEFENMRKIDSVRLVFDSKLNRWQASKINIKSNYRIESEQLVMPETLVKDFVVEGKDAEGNWTILETIKDNHRRLVRIKIGKELLGVRITPKSTWGKESTRLFAFDLC